MLLIAGETNTNIPVLILLYDFFQTPPLSVRPLHFIRFLPLQVRDGLTRPTPAQTLRAAGRRTEHNQHFHCHGKSRKVADVDMQHLANRQWPWETAGVKGWPDDNFEPQAKINNLSVATNLI